MKKGKEKEMKKKNGKNRIAVLGTAFCLGISLVMTGCGKKETGETERQTSNETKGQTETVKDERKALSIYKKLHTNLQQYAAGNEELPLFKELAARTDTELTFMTPPVGQEKEQFNLIIASGEYPDIFVDMWTDYTGGGAKALSDEVIISLNTLIDEHAPNIKAALEEYPDSFRYVTNEKGEIYGVPMVFTNKMQQVTWGVNLRKDWLDELGMEIPDTVDEYYQALKGFKEVKGATSPFTITFEHLKNSNFLAGAYGVSNSFYQENGEIKYGPIQTGYREYLKTLNQWYQEGLLDQDFATIDANTRGAKMLNEQAGMSWAPSKGGVAAWNQGLQEKNPDAEMIGAPYAALNEGETVKFGQLNPCGSMSGAISSTCEDPVKAIEFLDYMYSDEGRMLLNFGIEGESYNLVDGEPELSELIMGSTDMPVLSKMNMYATSAEGNAGLPTIVDQRYLEQINSKTPNITEALETWAESSTFENEIPGIIAMSEDSSRYAGIMNEVITYRDEMILKFIMGQESIDDKYDEYVKNIQNKGIEEAVEIMQKAYDSFKEK